MTILDNGVVTLRMPQTGETKFDRPLAMGQDHEKMLAASGIAPGPIQGVRLVDGRWVGGSYFFAANPQPRPR